MSDASPGHGLGPPPLVVELPDAPPPEVAFTRLCRLPHCLFLDSAQRDAELGRYSFLAADPFEFRAFTAEDRAAWPWLQGRLDAFGATTVRGLPPFQGGAAGLLGYDLGRQFERLPSPRIDEFRTPALAFGLYDVVLAYDHAESRAWLMSHGWPQADSGQRRKRASDRLAWLRDCVLGRAAAGPAPLLPATLCPDAAVTLPRESLAPQFAVGRLPDLTSNFSREAYLETVERAIEYIRAGDIFQVNLAQRLLHPATEDSPTLYLRLRERNAAPFAGYFDLGDFQLASASPERFLSAFDRQVEARPIKGTRRRTARPEADLFAGDELRASEKDRAENTMIVDLLRNDLSRVCRPESVFVSQLCRLETYAYVQHLVSAVRGELRPGLGPLDLLRGTFPGGSITGAPKVRAMEIVAELEPTARGPYCGALAYIGFDGSLDASILIRTITVGKGWRQLPVGGGIVAQSQPEREYEETWHKAEGMLRALVP